MRNRTYSPETPFRCYDPHYGYFYETEIGARLFVEEYYSIGGCAELDGKDVSIKLMYGELA